MKRIAGNVLVLMSGDCIPLQSIELDADGHYLKHMSLHEEQAATIWTGGVLVLLPVNIVPSRNENLKDLLSRIHTSNSSIESLRLWKAEALDATRPFDGQPSNWSLLSE